MDPLAQLQTSLRERYQVLREIGAGGMATVYLARDLRHDRQVALKLLRPELGAVLGVERFLSEIKVTANLQHPHLLPLFDSGEAEGLLFYVMPYVQGESLRARLTRERVLPVQEAVKLTVAVASALDYAHRHGVIHRDLKPENILLHDGQPMVSDFGIALAISNAGGSRITQTGMSLGTPEYMSPEQATGTEGVDARSDQYSLAAVLYEMLGGEPPHTAATVQALIARVLTERPRPVRATRDAVPVHVERSLQKALAKLPADRFQSAAQFAEALEHPELTAGLAPDGTVTGPVTPLRRIGQIVPWVIAAGAVAFALLRPGAGAPAIPGGPLARLLIPPPPSLAVSTGVSQMILSPDGGTLLVGGQGTRGTGFLVRNLNDTVYRLLPGTERGRSPMFSPDGKSIAFVADSGLWRVPLGGGQRGFIAKFGLGGGGSWGRRDTIVIAIAVPGRAALWKVPATGGEAVRLTQPDSGEADLFPSYLWDDKTIVFSRTRTPNLDQPRLMLLSPDGQVTDLGARGLKPRVVADRYLVYTSPEGDLMAALLDLGRRRFSKQPVNVSEQLAQQFGTEASRAVGWDVSANGTLAFFSGGAERSQLVLVDRGGKAEALHQAIRYFRLPRVLGDGSRILVQVSEGPANTLGSRGASDIWMLDRRVGALTRVTFDGRSGEPVPTPDGKGFAFARRDPAQGDPDIYWQSLTEEQPAKLLIKRPRQQFPYAWTPDGRTLVFTSIGDSTTGQDILAVSLDSLDKPWRVVADPFVTRLAKLSPNGRWLAYTSNESGGFEVYVRPFGLSGTGGKQQVSTAGGDQPMWSPDGRELFYRDSTSLVALQVESGTTFRVTGRATLFRDEFEGGANQNYDFLPDGKLVMVKSVEQGAWLTVLVNWLQEIDRKFPSP